MKPVTVTPDELMRSKRAAVVLAEVVSTPLMGQSSPVELREDVLVLMKLLRRLEGAVKVQPRTE